ncbi:MAG: hypothetical protein RR251_08520 [Hydrogenoanaerobacterium sp.]
MEKTNLKQAVINKVKERLPQQPATAVLECVDRAEEYFLGLTKRKSVPLSAFYLWIDLALRMNKLETGSESSGRISSIKRGDTTIQYENGGSTTDAASLEERILSYRVARAR